jgi:nuclear pore complex protein Nup54
MSLVMEKWDTSNPNCSFQYYFYNKVEEATLPFYRPGPNEDERKWEEALSKKPGPLYVPVLCTGFVQLGERIKAQQQNLAILNRMLHEINGCLEKLLNDHDLKTSVRAMEAKRKTAVLKQRCMTLATKVQVLRNRGYAMGGDEEELKRKLLALERRVTDPGLNARVEELWARMCGVRERTRVLEADMARAGADAANDGLDEETVKRSEKVRDMGFLEVFQIANHGQILEDYAVKIQHLKKEMKTISEEYQKWEQEQGPGSK